VSNGSTKKIENKRVSENRLDNLPKCGKVGGHGRLSPWMLGKLTWTVRAHGCQGYGMLRNKDGIKKDDIRIMDWCDDIFCEMQRSLLFQ
jgi:hypothetical protein